MSDKGRLEWYINKALNVIVPVIVIPIVGLILLKEWILGEEL